MARSSRDVLIRILTEGDSSGVEQIGTDLQGLARRAESVGNKMSLYLTAPLVGVGSLAFGSLIKRGIEFNKTLEDTETAVAAILSKFGGAEFDTAEKQLAGAARGVEELKRQAETAPGTIQDLAQGFTALAGPALGAGLSLEETIDLTVRLSQAMSRLGLDQRQLVQEGRALVTGNITLDASLAKVLEVTNEQIRTAREQGNLYGFLVEQLGGMAEAADNTTTRLSNFQDLLDKIAGRISEPAFDALSEGALSLSAALESMDSSDLEAMGDAVGELLETGVDLTKFLIELEPSSRNAGLGLLALAAATGPALKGLGALHKLAPRLALALGKGGLVSAAGAASYALGTLIDDATGASDKIAEFYNTLTDGGTGIGAELERQRSRLVDIAKEIETVADKEQLWNRAVQQRKVYVQEYQAELLKGNEEAAALFDQHVGHIDRLLGSLDQVLTVNQERITAQDELNEKTELQVELMLEGVGLTLSQIERQERIVKMHEIEMDILRAKKADNEDLVKQLEQQKREQQLINQFKAAEFTDEEATRMARERAAAEAAAASSSRERLNTVREIGQAQEENTRKLREGVRAEDFIGTGGERKQRFIENGRVIGTSDEFGRVGDPAPSGPESQPQQQPSPTVPAGQPGTANVDQLSQAIRSGIIDLSPAMEAIRDMQQANNAAIQSFATQISNLASQIEQLRN
ncbi:hypothetical protein DDZ13_07365 [Coraliomargarita sinensis]|uniref:Uncharacterized protein n=1 Tax=Coraliomargarita sinensis TaxID=2174842 RepID=A0A317ZJE4_9BACT|nr:hypothetical protein [Coraliomargarita sinensis]PXA04343.1 hypothetical protein DDZ13_07365 [Coraliomargarita sinensis]